MERRSRRRIAVVEDHLLQRKYTVSLVAHQPDLTVTFAGETLQDFLGWVEHEPRYRLPDLLLLDLMAERGADATPQAVRSLVGMGVRVVVFSALASARLVRQMIHAGVHGVVGKRDSEADIVQAIRSVLGGEAWMSQELATIIAHDPSRPQLSDQEERLLVLYASGLTMDAAASAIGVKRDTAKKYLQRVKAKYAAVDRPLRSRAEIVRAASADGYLSLGTQEQ